MDDERYPFLRAVWRKVVPEGSPSLVPTADLEQADETWRMLDSEEARAFAGSVMDGWDDSWKELGLAANAVGITYQRGPTS